MKKEKRSRWRELVRLYLDDMLAVAGGGCLTAAALLAGAVTVAKGGRR